MNVAFSIWWIWVWLCHRCRLGPLDQHYRFTFGAWGTPQQRALATLQSRLVKMVRISLVVPSIASHFYDLERVEVLKGPQGTLYGRNATGGAVNLITKRPDLEEISGYVSTDIGDYDKIQIEGAVNVPLSETFAARISAISVDRDGYMSDETSDDEHYSARLQTLWEPNERVSWRFQGQYSEYDGRGPGFTYVSDHFEASLPAA